MSLKRKYYFIVAEFVLLVLAFNTALKSRELASNIFFLTAVLLLNFWGALSVKKRSYLLINKKEICSIIILYVLFAMLFLGAIRYGAIQQIDGIGWLIFVMETVSFIIVGVYLVLYFLNYKQRPNYKDWIIVCIVCCVFFLCSIGNIICFPSQDAGIYLDQISSCANGFDFTMNSASNAQLAGHMSAGYALYALIGEFWLPELYMGVKVSNIVLAILVIISVDLILKKAITYKNILHRGISISLFAFSLWLFGMVENVSVDYGLMCCFVFWLLFYVMDMSYMQLISSILFVCTKEPAILIMSGMAVGVYVYKFVNYKEKNVLRKIFLCLNIKEWLSYVVPILFWIDYYLFKPLGWTEHGAVFNGLYYIYKVNYVGSHIRSVLKLLFVANFQWVITSAIILLTIVLKVKCIKFDVRWRCNMIMLICADIFYVAFNAAYCVQEYFRYHGVHYVIMMFIMLILVDRVCTKETLANYFLGILCGLICIENFVTYDPISRGVYPNLNAGGGVLLVTDTVDTGHYFSDNVKYNRQYLYWQKNLREILSDIKYSEEDLIVFPEFCPDSCIWDEWCIIGRCANLQNGLFFSEERKIVSNIPFISGVEVNYMFGDVLNNDQIDLKQYKNVYYIDMNLYSNEISPTNVDFNRCQQIGEYSYMTWTSYVYKVM